MYRNLPVRNVLIYWGLLNRYAKPNPCQSKIKQIMDSDLRALHKLAYFIYFPERIEKK